MVREIATVTAIDGDTIELSTELKSGCSGCAKRSTCGAGILSRALPNRRGQFSITSTEPYTLGQSIQLELPETTLTRYALALYLLPLIALLAGAALGHWLQPAHEGLSIALGGAGFGLSFFALKAMMKYKDVQVQRLLKVSHLPDPS